METQSHLCAAYDRKYLQRDEFGKLYGNGNELRKMIIGFVRSMVKPQSGVRSIRRVKSWSEKVAEIYERVTGRPPPAPVGSDGKPIRAAEGNGQPKEGTEY